MFDSKLTDEFGRLAALDRYCVLDSEREPAFDKITSLVKAVLGAPICAVSLIDEDRQWFKSSQGLDVTETARDIAFCDHTIRSREALIVPDAKADARFAHNPLVIAGPRIASYAGVPLETPDGYNLGALCAIDTEPRVFSAAQIGILHNFAALVVDELELRLIARKDHLTGAMTRRAFVEQAEQALATHRQTGRACSLIAIDVDHFKAVNDSYGHPVGDGVLKAVVQACQTGLDPKVSIGRLGGEEFALLLPESGAAAALVQAERMRVAIEALRLDVLPRLRVTASFGVAPVHGETPTLERWLADADAALYSAKRHGRNRYVLIDNLFQQSAA